MCQRLSDGGGGMCQRLSDGGEGVLTGTALSGGGGVEWWFSDLVSLQASVLYRHPAWDQMSLPASSAGGLSVGLTLVIHGMALPVLSHCSIQFLTAVFR
jgi:hypothetical protein